MQPVSFISLPALPWTDRHHAIWEECACPKSAANPMSDSKVIQLALEHFHQANAIQPRLVVGLQNGRAICCYILVPQTWFGQSTCQPSQIPIGLVQVKSPETLEFCTRQMLDSLGFSCCFIDLLQLDPIVYSRPASNYLTASTDYIQTGHICLPTEVAQYTNSLGKNLQKNVRKQKRRISALGATLELKILTEPISVDDAIEQFARLESGSWKQKRGTALGGTSEQLHFYRQLFRFFAARGEAQIVQYFMHSADGISSLIASDLCVSRGNTIHLLKTAYDEQLVKSARYQGLSPAVLMHHDYFIELINNHQISRVEFFGRMMEWHGQWTDQVRSLYHLTIYRNRAIVSLDRIRKLTGKNTKQDISLATAHLLQRRSIIL